MPIENLDVDRYGTYNDGEFLEIKKIGIMDATRFKCVARNEAGVDSISYTVDVNIPPVIENVRNTEQIIIEGRVLRTNLIYSYGSKRPLNPEKANR